MELDLPKYEVCNPGDIEKIVESFDSKKPLENFIEIVDANGVMKTQTFVEAITDTFKVDKPKSNVIERYISAKILLKINYFDKGKQC